MRIPALSAVLLAGLVSLVSAAPADKESTERVSYSDDEGASKDAARNENGEWVQLADPTPAKHGKEYISVGADAGTFTRIRVDASEGRPIVRAVRVDFKVGKSKVVRVDRVLKKEKSAYVDLGGAREISQVVVITDSASRGLYTVNAEVGHAGVATR